MTLICLSLMLISAYLFVKFVYWLYNRISYNLIVQSINNKFEELLIDNNYVLDHYHLEEFMDRNHQYVEDIVIDLNEDNAFVYTLQFRENI